MNMRPMKLLTIAALPLGMLTVTGCEEAKTPTQIARGSPPADELPKPNPRGGSYKKSDPGKWEYTTPK